MGTRRSLPWSIEWPAALFIGIAAFLTLVWLGSSRFPLAEAWLDYATVWAIFGSLACGVLRGWRWVRWVLLGILSLQIMGWLVPAYFFVRRAPVEVWTDRGIQAAFLLATGLCFLPASSRYFAASKKANGASRASESSA